MDSDRLSLLSHFPAPYPYPVPVPVPIRSVPEDRWGRLRIETRNDPPRRRPPSYHLSICDLGRCEHSCSCGASVSRVEQQVAAFN